MRSSPPVVKCPSNDQQRGKMKETGARQHARLVTVKCLSNAQGSENTRETSRRGRNGGVFIKWPVTGGLRCWASDRPEPTTVSNAARS